MTRAGQTITSTYDVLDRVATKAVPAVSGVSAANTTSWAYDLAGKVTSLTDTLGNSLSNSYDLAGRQLGETQTVPGLAAKTVSYQYDQAGNRSRISWPDGYYVTYAYDAANRLLGANENGSTALAAYDYDALGHRATVQYGAAGVGAKVSYSWSTEDDLLTLSHDLAGTANDNAFTDTYTPAHQIAASTISNPAFQYVQPLAGTASYTTNGLNQYSSITPVGGSATSIGYDLNGNLTSDGNFAFAYDPENRLMTANKTGTAVAYAYDPLDRRSTKTVNGTATFFVHSGADEIAEYDGSGNLLRRYVPSGAVDEPIAMVTSAGTKTFFHQDKTDSIVAMSDTSGNLTEGPYTYDAYGNGAPATGVPFKYTGQRLDPETGLYYYRARYYSSSLGRFLQTDSIGYKDDIDWYNYVQEDPTDKTDPSGNSPLEIVFAIADVAQTVSDIRSGASVGELAMDAGNLVLDVAPVPGLSEVAHVAEAAHAAVEVEHVVSGAEHGAQEAGIVYRRTNPVTGRKYIGRANSETHFAARQRAHDRRLGIRHDYQIVDRASPGKPLREAEQRAIDDHGGPTNKSNPEGGTENKRNEIRKPNTACGSREGSDCH